VNLYKIYNGGHTWPGSTSSGMPGIVCKDISASDIAWEFFKLHSLGSSSNAAPVVTLVKPLIGAVLTAPANININATAIDADGTISKVEFFNGSNSLKVDETAAYSYSWKNVPAGIYTIKAVATDNKNKTSETTVLVTVLAGKIGAEEIGDDQMQAFYNVYNQQLIIEKPAGQTSYDLMINDLQGRMLLSMNNVQETEKAISTNKFPEGNYFYSLRTIDGNRVSGNFAVVH
jgi:hypothetical protein